MIAVDFEVQGQPSVNVDNLQAARECAEHAFQQLDGPAAILGLRLISANRVCRIQSGELFDERSTITIQRLHGFLDAARKRGIEIPSQRIFHVPDNTHSLGYEAAQQALTRSPRPKLLLCMSDRIALAAIQVARHLGLRVPEDVRITGFDDIPEAATQHPTLTTVHQQSVDKGRLAAEIFLGQREAQAIVLPTELMVRESCPSN